MEHLVATYDVDLHTAGSTQRLTPRSPEPLLEPDGSAWQSQSGIVTDTDRHDALRAAYADVPAWWTAWTPRGSL